jgi:hypothetical protein
MSVIVDAGNTFATIVIPDIATEEQHGSTIWFTQPAGDMLDLNRLPDQACQDVVIGVCHG